jgi:hypothetical protein
MIGLTALSLTTLPLCEAIEAYCEAVEDAAA